MVVLTTLKAFWLNLLAIATLISGAVLFFVDPIRSWTEDHGRGGWGLAAILGASALALLNLYLNDHAALQSERTKFTTAVREREATVDRNSELVTECANLKVKVRRLTAELDNSQRALEELRRKPTDRDKQMFAAVIDSFPRDGKLFQWLDALFSAKMWKAGDIDALQGVLSVISRHRMVDDAELVKPLALLEAAINQFLDWTALNGEGVDHLNARKQVTDPTWTYRAYDGEDLRRMRGAGWVEADQARDAGIACGKRILAAREEFERIGRARKL